MRRPGQRRVVVVMPARNAARTLQRMVAAIPPDCVDEIILVDDFSTDGTIRVARETLMAGLRLILHCRGLLRSRKFEL